MKVICFGFDRDLGRFRVDVGIIPPVEPADADPVAADPTEEPEKVSE